MKGAIGLDSNVLARYYVDDELDATTQRQREGARRLIESGRPLAVSKTVILELEWVLRGYYKFGPAEIGHAAFGHAYIKKASRWRPLVHSKPGDGVVAGSLLQRLIVCRACAG